MSTCAVCSRALWTAVTAISGRAAARSHHGQLTLACAGHTLGACARRATGVWRLSRPGIAQAARRRQRTAGASASAQTHGVSAGRLPESGRRHQREKESERAREREGDFIRGAVILFFLHYCPCLPYFLCVRPWPARQDWDRLSTAVFCTRVVFCTRIGMRLVVLAGSCAARRCPQPLAQMFCITVF